MRAACDLLWTCIGGGRAKSGAGPDSCGGGPTLGGGTATNAN